MEETAVSRNLTFVRQATSMADLTGSRCRRSDWKLVIHRQCDARPTVTFPVTERNYTKLYCLGCQGQYNTVWTVNSCWGSLRIRSLTTIRTHDLMITRLTPQRCANPIYIQVTIVMPRDQLTSKQKCAY